MNNAELVDLLCGASSTLFEARRVHLKNFGTLIPHVFMGDVLARVGACVASGEHLAPHARPGELAGILAALERGMTHGDRETRNVVSISFINDGEIEKFFRELRPLLGPRISGQVQGR